MSASLYATDIPHAPGGRAESAVVPLATRLTSGFISRINALRRRPSTAADSNSDDAEDAEATKALLANFVPAVAECTDVHCGGPTYCVHKWLPPVSTRPTLPPSAFSAL